ncbi:signal peptide peptidase SppA [Psychromonas sp. KJ10-10]|uniref:signal peptide peptidase SppA n=1 Tax=Psychromonas sp. KJ10-10 TaxID=3391823 RepID=UPI0039B59262
MSDCQHTNINKQSISPTLEQLKQSLQESNGDTALYALNAGLVDQLLPRYKVVASLESEKYKWVNYQRYQSTLPALYQTSIDKPLIALIHGQGEILNGSQTSNAIGGDSFSALLDKALKSPQIKAVVIRLDTPGGSAFASEKIRQHILDLKSAGKKVVVSMASTSASGGYWIASATRSYCSFPSTLTGSIGIFGLFASADKALNKIGIYNDGVGTSPLSTITPARALDPKLADIMQIGIERGYQQFLTVVSEGRNMSLQQVDAIAQGRVWTGDDAKSLGLVDELGDLKQAISSAASLANLEDYNVQPIKVALSAKQQFLNEVLTNGVKMSPNGLSLNSSLIESFFDIKAQTSLLTRFNDPKGHYLYCPMCFINK